MRTLLEGKFRDIQWTKYTLLLSCILQISGALQLSFIKNSLFSMPFLIFGLLIGLLTVPFSKDLVTGLKNLAFTLIPIPLNVIAFMSFIFILRIVSGHVEKLEQILTLVSKLGSLCVSTFSLIWPLLLVAILLQILKSRMVSVRVKK